MFNIEDWNELIKVVLIMGATSGFLIWFIWSQMQITKDMPKLPVECPPVVVVPPPPPPPPPYEIKYMSKYLAMRDLPASNMIIEKTPDGKNIDNQRQRFVLENTPIGNVFMKYDLEAEKFVYWSDRDIPTTFLEVVARKYVTMFWCCNLYINMVDAINDAPEKRVLPVIKHTGPLYVVVRKNETGKNKNNTTGEKVKLQSNRFGRKGKLCEFAEIKETPKRAAPLKLSYRQFLQNMSPAEFSAIAIKQSNSHSHAVFSESTNGVYNPNFTIVADPVDDLSYITNKPWVSTDNSMFESIGLMSKDLPKSTDFTASDTSDNVSSVVSGLFD